MCGIAGFVLRDREAELTVALDRSAAVEAGQVDGAALGTGAIPPAKISSVGVRSRARAAV
jgi:hypothetical protein